MPRMKRPRIRERTFVVYYGYGPLPGIEQFDLAILEPGGWRTPDLEALRRRGMRLLAYVSVLEAPRWVIEEAGIGYRDFLHLQDGPWRREAFDTVVIDPRSEAWRSYLRHRFRRIAQGPWDGVFLDGLGDVEDPAVQSEASWMAPAVAEIVRSARETLGEGLIVQNNGLWLVLPLVAEFLDGIVWEGALTARDFEEPWALMTSETLVRYANLHGIEPMLLSEVPAGPGEEGHLRALQDAARRYGFLAYAAPSGYAEGIRLPDRTIVPGRRLPIR